MRPVGIESNRFGQRPGAACKALPGARALGRLALAFLAALAAASSAEDGPRLEGRVLDSLGRAVPGAIVSLQAPGADDGPRARTDADGRFAFEGLAESSYVLTASARGHAAVTHHVSIPAPDGLLELRLPAHHFREHVTVVATRLIETEEDQRRIPGSVDVLGADVLRTSRVFNLNEALAKVPGLIPRDEEGFALRPNIGLRGLNPTRSSKVLLLEDGVPVTYAPYGDNASYYHPPVERFEAIEVLKGSGQIRYGPSTIAGVINYLTPDPPERWTGQASLTGGSREYVDGRGRMGGTWGRTGLLLDATRKQGDGSRENVHSELTDANLKALVNLGATHTLTLKGGYYGEDSNNTYSGLREDEYRADPRQNPFRNDFFYGDRVGVSARHAALLGAQVLVATQAYLSRFKRHWWRQSSNSGQRPNDSADPACGGMAHLLTACGNEGRLREYVHWGIEPRARLAHRLVGLAGETEVGLRAHFEDQERIQKNGDTSTARDGVIVENNERRNEAFSGFVQSRWTLGRFALTPGMRIEHVRYLRTNRLANAGSGVSGRTSLTQWVPGLGLALTPSQAATVFAGVHRGFAPPRTEDIISNSTGGVVDLDAELSWNFELGLRARPARGVRLGATFFRMDYENQIVPASLAGGVGATLTNGGETLHQGLEAWLQLDGDALLGSRHRPYLRVALTALPVARFEGTRMSSVSGFAAVSVSGNRLPYAPERSITATLGYAHPAGVDVQLEGVHVSRQFGDDLNTLEATPDGQRGLIPAHTLWNATVNWTVRRHVTVFATVKNLLDRTFIVDRSRGILPGTPRRVQAGVSLGF